MEELYQSDKSCKEQMCIHAGNDGGVQTESTVS